MHIGDIYNLEHQKLEEQVCEYVKTQLTSQLRVTDVKVENLSGKTGQLKVKITFRYGGALVYAWLDRRVFTADGSGWPPPDISFDGQKVSVVDMIAALRPKYQNYLKKQVDKLEASSLPDNMTRKQRAFMLQQIFIEAGFSADIRLLTNGQIRLIVGHDEVKSTIKEVVIS